jgi:hypothetical protein
MVPKMKRVARLLAAIAFLAPVAAFGQVPGGDELAINKTPIIGGTTGRCLYDNAGKVGEQVCAGAATSITINTTTITGGTTTRVLYDNAGTIGEYTNAQLTALINAATASLPGALPAWPNNTTTFFRGDGTYATLNCSALGGSGAFCSGTDAANLTGTVASARLSGSYTGITGVGALAAGSAGAGFSINLTAVTLTNVLPAANGGAGTITGALKGNGSGTVSQAACADLSNGGTACSAATGTSGATVPLLNGTNAASGVWTFSPSGGNAAIFRTTGGGSSQIIVDTSAASQQSSLTLWDNSIPKWSLIKNTDQTFIFYDNPNNVVQMTLTGGTGSTGTTGLAGQLLMPNITTSSAAQTGTVCWITGTGKFTVDTTTTCLASILSAKNVISRPTPANALGIVQKLSPISFRYKDGWGDSGEYEQFGLGAEEVALVDERLIGRDTKGKLRGVRYQELTAVLTGAIQQLKADNDNLRERIEKIEGRK